eukprot:761777-Hanusia_phi.AAC.3
MPVSCFQCGSGDPSASSSTSQRGSFQATRKRPGVSPRPRIVTIDGVFHDDDVLRFLWFLQGPCGADGNFSPELRSRSGDPLFKRTVQCFSVTRRHSPSLKTSFAYSDIIAGTVPRYASHDSFGSGRRAESPWHIGSDPGTVRAWRPGGDARNAVMPVMPCSRPPPGAGCSEPRGLLRGGRMRHFKSPKPPQVRVIFRLITVELIRDTAPARPTGAQCRTPSHWLSPGSGLLRGSGRQQGSRAS